MKIVFLGTVDFSKTILLKLIELKARVVGVITQSNSSINSDYVDLVPICETNNIPYLIADYNDTDQLKAWISNLSPDILFCFGWSRLIKKEILEIPPMGVVGYHPAELPFNRGRHPLIWALFLGLESTASTFFFMNEQADAGDILSQAKISIGKDDDAATLYAKIAEAGVKQVEEFYPLLVKREFKRVPQQHQLSNNWRKRGKKDGLIDFRMTSSAIYNLVRALTHPYVGAHLVHNNGDIKIWKVREVANDNKNIEPGKVIEVTNLGVVVKTFDAAIELLEHEFDTMPSLGEYL